MNLTIPEKFQYLEINEQWQKALKSIYNGGYNTLLVGKAGCLSGNTMVRYNRNSLGRSISIEDLYCKENKISYSPTKRNKAGEPSKVRQYTVDTITKVRSLNENENYIQLNGIDKVIYSGKKELFLITLEDGKSIEATKDHRFMTDRGWVKLKDLNNTDSIMVDNTTKGKIVTTKSERRKTRRIGKKRNEDLSKTVGEFYPNKVVKSYSKDRVVLRYAKAIHILIYEAYVLNNVSLGTYLGWTYDNTVNWEDIILVDSKKNCIHHVDNDHTNNDIDNLKMMSHKEHLLHHAHTSDSRKNFGCNNPEFSKIIGMVKLKGLYHTYDICCNNPHNSFVANGMVVHNSGKSEFINLMKELDHINKINTLYVAPTGVSALRIGGSTIHSAFKQGIQMIYPEKAILSKDTRELLEVTDKIVIDEASMLTANLIDIMDHLCKIAKGDYTNLFGNIQVIIVCDLYQLPPVVGRTKEEKDFFYGMYEDNPYFFGSTSYIENEDTFNKIEFNHIYRQDDSNFKEILNRIRVGEQTDGDLDIINSRRTSFRKYKREFSDWTYISPYNEKVSEINTDSLNALPTKEIILKANVSGYINPKNFLVPLSIIIKENAKVMMLVNDSKKRFQNGTRGKFIRMKSPNEMLIEINGREIIVEKHEFAEYKYIRKGKELTQNKKGSFKQFPLRLAYAITIHKTQSSTFNEGYIDFGHSLKFTDHLAYVALSRFSDLNRIGLKRELTHDDICVSELVKDFMAGFVEDYVPPPRENKKKIAPLDAWDIVKEDLPF